MADMPFRRVKLQQQFVPRTSTSFADCAATAGAMMADADSRGKYIVNHADVRRNTSEPVPDPNSPGLTIEQVSRSVSRLTDGQVKIEVHRIGSPWQDVVDACVAGAWAQLALWRGVLIDAGFGGNSPFRGGHGTIYTYDQNMRSFILGDPLTPYWLNVPPNVAARACAAFLTRIGVGAGIGQAYFGLTKDVYSYDPAEETPQAGDVMFNVAPQTTHRDLILKPNTILYSDSALTKRYSHSNTSKKQAFAFDGAGDGFYAIINGGYTNYIHRDAVLDTINNDRTFE